MNYIIYNGAIVSESDFMPGLSNRAFLYGDGLFETMMLRKGVISFFSDHFERITEGLSVLGMKASAEWKKSFVEEKILELCLKNNYKDKARIKLLVFRKPGGLVTPASTGFDYIVLLADYSQVLETKEKTIFCDEVMICKTSYSKYKTCNFLPYIQASIYKSKMKVDEVIISDAFGNIAECTTSNIFWGKDNVLFTPSTDTGCIAGIMRKQIIKTSKDIGINIEEGEYVKKDLLDADFAFTSNSSGLSSLIYVEGTKFDGNASIYQQIASLIVI